MKTLNNEDVNKKIKIHHINDDERLLGRLISFGLIEGTDIEILMNNKNFPTVVYARDTMIAINKDEASKIFVEEI